MDTAQSLVLAQDGLDGTALSKLNLMLKSCPTGYCRSEDLHDRAGYYARAFVTGMSSGYVGYSESIHFGIQYSIDNCTQTSGCVSVDDIAVRRPPGFHGAAINEGIGWVDALTLDANLDSNKKQLATQFIEFMVSDAAYKAVLEPEWGEAPKYLIPAKTGVTIENAPLYTSFYRSHTGRKTGTSIGLNDKLREIGKKLDCALPISRTDTETLQRCLP